MQLPTVCIFAAEGEMLYISPFGGRARAVRWLASRWPQLSCEPGVHSFIQEWGLCVYILARYIPPRTMYIIYLDVVCVHSASCVLDGMFIWFQTSGGVCQTLFLSCPLGRSMNSLGEAHTAGLSVLVHRKFSDLDAKGFPSLAEKQKS